jgi:hypothetical protein
MVINEETTEWEATGELEEYMINDLLYDTIKASRLNKHLQLVGPEKEGSSMQHTQNLAHKVADEARAAQREEARLAALSGRAGGGAGGSKRRRSTDDEEATEGVLNDEELTSQHALDEQLLGHMT